MYVIKYMAISSIQQKYNLGNNTPNKNWEQ